MTLGCEVNAAIEAGDVELVKKLCADHLNELLEDGRTPLIVSIQCHQLNVAEALLELGAKADVAWQKCVVNPWNPAVMTTDSWFPLQVALDEKWVAGVELLLTRGKACESQCRGGLLGLLEFLVEGGCVGLVRLVVSRLEEGNLFCISSMTHFTPLLLDAVRQRSVAMVNLLVDLGVSVNSVHNDMLPLTLAADMEDTPLCTRLLELGAHLGQWNTGSNPAALAIQGGLSRALAFLLTLGADPNCEVSWNSMVYKSQVLESGSRLLHLAVAKHNLTVIQTLVTHGASILHTDSCNNTPLHVACKDRDIPLEVLTYLLRPDVFTDRSYVNARNKQGQSPLLCGCGAGSVAVVEALLAAGGDVGVFDLEGRSCLHCAVESGSEALVLLLLRRGVSVKARKQRSALQVAVELGDEVMTGILLDYKGQVGGGDSQLLHLAVRSGNEVLVERLLQQDLSVDSFTPPGLTPLMLAASAGHTAICHLLITHRASLNLCATHTHEAALNMAVYYGQQEAARSLMSEGACLTLQDKREATPLHWCFHNCRAGLLQLLLMAGVPFTFTDLLSFPQTLALLQCADMVHWLFQHITHPRSLQDLCVLRTRRHLKTQARGKGIGKLVHRLPLPDKLRQCVMLQHLHTQEFDV